jgi:hypothetical protein
VLLSELHFNELVNFNDASCALLSAIDLDKEFNKSLALWYCPMIYVFVVSQYSCLREDI